MLPKMLQDSVVTRLRLGEIVNADFITVYSSASLPVKEFYKYQLSPTNPRGSLQHGECAANK